MSHYCKYMTVRFMLLVSVPIRCFDVNAMEESKCPRLLSSVYTNCSVDYTVMAMWCDSTNLKAVPHHRSSFIETQTPAKRAKRIYINESCVNNLNPVILGNYLDLIVFSVNNNEVTRVEAKTFASNRKLQTLILSNNRISHLHDNAFVGLKSLIRLNLKGNRLRKIRRLLFNDTANLQTLDLSNNLISYIHDEAFLQLRFLKVLLLTENRLHTISGYILTGLHQLRTLNVARNHLAKLDSGMFHSSQLIAEVDFTENNISCIPRDLLMERDNIRVFRINKNKLSTPKPEWYRNVWRKRDRNLVGDNPLKENFWSCGCDSYRYRDFLRIEVTDEDWKELLDVECSFPLHLRGRTLSSLGDVFFKNCTVSSKDINDCSGDDWNLFNTDPHPRHAEEDAFNDGNDQRNKREEQIPSTTVPPTTFITLTDKVKKLPKSSPVKNKLVDYLPKYQKSDEWIKIGVICGCAVSIAIIICVSTICVYKHKVRIQLSKNNDSTNLTNLKNNKQDIEESRKMIKNGKYRISDSSILSLSIESEVRELNPAAEEHTTTFISSLSAHTTPKLVQDSNGVSPNMGAIVHANQASFDQNSLIGQIASTRRETFHDYNSDATGTHLCDQAPPRANLNQSPSFSPYNIPPALEGVLVSPQQNRVPVGRTLTQFVHNDIATQ